MASENLYIPEENLRDVILVIRLGMIASKIAVDPIVIDCLTNWCNEREDYINHE